MQRSKNETSVDKCVSFELFGMLSEAFANDIVNLVRGM
jgi:hypothetical protein